MTSAPRIGLITVLHACTFSLASAQQPFDLDPTFRAEFDDWYVSSILPLPDGDVIISGQIDFNGSLEFRSGGRLNADGTRDLAFSDLTYMGGKLTEWNGLIYAANGPGVRRLHFDGSLDPAFDMVNAPYFAVLQGGDYHVYPDGSILMSGAHQVNYPDSNWVGIYNLIWFTDEGYLDTTRAPRMGDGTIDYFKELPDGKFICTGPMSMYEGYSTSNIFRVHADGSFDPSFSTGTDWGQAFACLPLSDGRCYVGGLFTTATAMDTLQLVRLMPDGTLDPTFNNYLRFGSPPPISNPWGLGVISSLNWLDDGRIIATGTFRNVDGESRGSICVIDTNGVLLDNFMGAGCGTHTYQGFTDAAIQDILFTGDSMCYIWGDYHGYNDGVTSDPDQRFVTRLYGPDFTTSLQEQPAPAQVQIYPNPACDIVSIELSALLAHAELTVSDALGRELLRQALRDRTTTLQVQTLGGGAYSLELFGAGQRLGVRRFVVQH